MLVKRLSLLHGGIVGLITLSLLLTHHVVLAETNVVRIATQDALCFLPLMEMKQHKLVQKQALAEGLNNIKVVWANIGGGASANEMLISGSVDFVTGGTSLITVWARSKGTINIKGVASTCATPWILTTDNPNVRTIKDFTARDKIAVPAVKISTQAITLQMAAAKMFGEKNYDKLDKLTVSMKNADALIALTSGHSQITAHFSGPPFPQIELLNPKIHQVLASEDVLGGPGMDGNLYTTKKFHDENPHLYKVVLDALREAQNAIKADPYKAAELYVALHHSKIPLEVFQKIISSPHTHWDLTPLSVMKFASFMYKTGQIPFKPNSWKDLFFSEIHDLPGS